MLYSIFVGINSYKDIRISGLNYASADAMEFNNLFLRAFKTEDLETHLLLDQDATKLKILKILGEDISRKANENDIVIAYFSGHGAKETSDSIDTFSRYLVMHDTEIDSIYATALNIEDELITLIKRIRANLVFVIIDSCFSGKAGGKTFENPRLNPNPWRAKINLKNLDLGQGRLILTAADEDEIALENSNLKHGVFTHFLMEGLSDSTYPAYTISAAMLYDSVAKKVQNYTRDAQHPIMVGRSRDAQIPHLAAA